MAQRGIKLAVTILAVITGLYQLYVAAFGPSSTEGLRITHWIFMSAILFLMYPATKKKFKGSWIVDVATAVIAVAPGIYLLLTADARAATFGLPTGFEVFLGLLLLGTVLEAARRTSGLALTIIAGVFLAYALYGHYLPGVLGHRKYSLARIIQYMYFSTDGIYGIALGVSATFIVLFVLFGSFLSVSGAGQLFIDGVLALTGKKKGGPAKAAVLSSALLGMISGSPVANVVTSGTYTIPLMKQTGYRDYEAGAIEAVASTGGMIMPPIMGAAAFLMADYLGLPYGRIALAAAIPAVLYFMSLLWSVHFRAQSPHIKALRPDEIPDLSAMKTKWYLLLPVVLLIVWLLIGWSATKAALWAIGALFITMLIQPDRKEIMKKLIAGVEDGIRNSIPVAAACAVAGIIVGVVNMTGLGVKFSTFMIEIAGGNSFLILVTTMLASLVLGMGLPATAVYILLASLSAPTLVQVGFTPLAAHMFVFYFGIISAITPPVALSAFAAAGIANSDPNQTGWYSFKLGMAAYLVPFLFAYNPALLMEGSVGTIIQVTITSVIGVSFWAMGVERHLDRPLSWTKAAMCLVGGALLMVPESRTDLIGLGLLGLFLFVHFVLHRKKKGSEELATH